MVSGWIKWWKTRKTLYVFLVVSALTLLGWRALQLEIVNDARSTLPEHEAFDQLKELIDSVAQSTTLFIAIEGQNEDSINFYWEKLDAIASKVGARSDDQFSQAFDTDIQSLYKSLPLLLTPDDYKEIEQLISSQTAKEALETGIARLSAPGSFIGGQSLVYDPYGIGALAFDRLRAAESLARITDSGNGLELVSGEEVRTYLMHDGLKSGDKVELLESLKSIRQLALDKEIKVHYFSSLLIEAENVRQIGDDLGFTLVIAVIAILILLILVYRQWLMPILFIVPGGIAIIMALGSIAIFKGQIAGIAIGAGSVVLGIVLDYSFHFFTHLQKSQSVIQSVKEVSKPLLLSCLTTVLAFGMLFFTSSPILADFGLFASLSLLAAAITVLFIMPVFIGDHTVKPLKWELPSLGSKMKYVRPVLVLGIFIVSFFMVGFLDEAQFDADLDNLNYYPEDLKQAEETFSGIKAEEEKRLFIKFEEASLEEYYATALSLEQMHKRGFVSGYLLKDYSNPSLRIKNNAVDRWNEFFKLRKDSLLAELSIAGTSIGFNESAFDPFAQLMFIEVNEVALNGQAAMSFLVAPKDELDRVKQNLENIGGVEVIDMRASAYSLVTAVEDDFNFILIASSLLVFIILLLIYGRFELAIITFLPMALSWIWIVGATVLLGMKFNFVNVILSTFIFGLGDDFSIFISDGYLNKHKYGKDSLKSYTSAIGLSAMTTLIGMAALLFAGHPAIQSISLLSVLGILIILFISLTLQPVLFRWLIINRSEKGLPPLTLASIFMSIMAFGVFILGSFVGLLVTVVIRLIPTNLGKRKRFLRRILQWQCLLLLYASISVRKRLVMMENLDMKNPSVIVTNHQSFIDILAMISLSPDLVIMTKKWVYKSPLFGGAVRFAGYLYTEDSPEETQRKIKERLDEGCSVMIFPEGTRTMEGEHKRWHKGAFFIADQYNMDITPVVLHGYGYAMPKNDFVLNRSYMTTLILPRIKFDDLKYGQGHRERAKLISAHVKEKYIAYDRINGLTNYHFNRILGAFLYKGPIVEWYFRIKWMLERRNFEHYDMIIPDEGVVYDLGCGYGYLSLYLSARSANRELIGIDYDKEKIKVAQNHYLVSEGLQFENEDLRLFNPKPAAAIFLNDVLHYMPEDEQLTLLNICAQALLPNGTLIIRDGLRDLEGKHGLTRLTEYFSTKLFKFNKTTDKLHFFDREFIEKFAGQNNMSVDFTPASKRTSNVLFVLKLKNTVS
ncbi:MAG: 1-acyl-sn-glycerol-3-phosphate acyltransferase [Flavobacteriales bacterium]|jgi:1-acyl-sn-glycerol-3-phosphate acyltransferase